MFNQPIFGSKGFFGKKVNVITSSVDRVLSQKGQQEGVREFMKKVTRGDKGSEQGRFKQYLDGYQPGALSSSDKTELGSTVKNISEVLNGLSSKKGINALGFNVSEQVNTLNSALNQLEKLEGFEENADLQDAGDLLKKAIGDLNQAKEAKTGSQSTVDRDALLKILNTANTTLSSLETDLKSRLSSGVSSTLKTLETTVKSQVSSVSNTIANTLGTVLKRGLSSNSSSTPSEAATKSSSSTPLEGNVGHYEVNESFDGKNDYYVVDHESSFLLDNGTIQFDFTANDTRGTQGLVNKDSSGFFNDDRGDFISFLEGDELYVQLQSKNRTYTLRGGEIEAGEKTDVAVTFGDEGFKLYVNGELKDEDSYTGGIGKGSGGGGNDNPWILGARSESSWRSNGRWGNWFSRRKSSDGGARDYFNGTIGSLNIHDQALSADQIAGKGSTEVSQKASGESQLLKENLVTLDTEGKTGPQITTMNRATASEALSKDGLVHYQIEGKLDGRNDFIEVAHDDAFMLNEGSVDVRFTADSKSGLQGILTKDSTGYDDGGHFSLYTKGGKVYARIQSDDKSYTLSGGKVTAGEEVDVSVSFGDKGFKLFVDGEEVDSSSYTGGLGTSSGGSGNENPWAIGAGNWGSSDNSNRGVSDHFDGKISDVVIRSSQTTEAQAASRAQGELVVYGEAVEDPVEDPVEEPVEDPKEPANPPGVLGGLFGEISQAAAQSGGLSLKDNLQEKGQELFSRLTNAISIIDKASKSDENYKVLQQKKEDLVSLRDNLAPYTKDIVGTQVSVGAALDSAGTALRSVLTKLGSADENAAKGKGKGKGGGAERLNIRAKVKPETGVLGQKGSEIKGKTQELLKEAVIGRMMDTQQQQQTSGAGGIRSMNMELISAAATESYVAARNLVSSESDRMLLEMMAVDTSKAIKLSERVTADSLGKMSGAEKKEEKKEKEEIQSSKDAEVQGKSIANQLSGSKETQSGLIHENSRVEALFQRIAGR